MISVAALRTMMHFSLLLHLSAEVALPVAVGFGFESIHTQHAGHVILAEQEGALHKEQSLSTCDNGKYEYDSQSESGFPHTRKVHRNAR